MENAIMESSLLLAAIKLYNKIEINFIRLMLSDQRIYKTCTVNQYGSHTCYGTHLPQLQACGWFVQCL